MTYRNSRIVVVLLSVLILVVGVSCNYIQYQLPDAGKPIESVADPNKEISRNIKGKHYQKSEDADGVVTETCTFAESDSEPYRKTIRTLTQDGKVKFRTFQSEVYGSFTLPGGSMSAHRYATTDELAGKLVELRYDVNPYDIEGMIPVPDFLLQKLPDVTIDGKTLKEFIQKAPQYGTWELVIGNDRSVWNASIDYMPQEIDAFFKAAGIKDLDESDGPDGARYYRYDMGSDLVIILKRYLRVDWIVAGQQDMTTVTFEMPTSVAVENLIPLFIPD